MSAKLNVMNMNEFISATFSRYDEDTPETDMLAVQELIEEAENFLYDRFPHIGEWAGLELNQANVLLNAGFQRLAIISVGKAIAISGLSPEEYAFGFAIAQKQARAISDMSSSRASNREIGRDAAMKLKASEALVAAHLEDVQGKTARILLERQLKAASKLEQKNRDEAYNLLCTQEKAMEALQEGERKIISHIQDLEQTLLWMAGTYADRASPSDSVFDGINRKLQDTQKETADLLRTHQENTAAELKKHQTLLAASLASLEKGDAEILKKEQANIAVNLKEEQEVEALKKEHAERNRRPV